MQNNSLPPRRVLVLMATYNGAKWISDQISSILNQTSVEIEIIIRDDFSTDKTVSIIESEFIDNKNLKLIRGECSSGSSGANFYKLYSIANAESFDFIALADQDDIWLPNKLSLAINLMDLNGADGYSSSVEAFWPDGKTKIISQNKNIRLSDYLFEGAGQGCTFLVSSVFFIKVQKFIYENNSLISQFHYHDWLLYILARAWKFRWFFDMRTLVRYRQHASNEIGARGSKNAMLKRLEKIRNGWYAEQISIASKIFLSIEAAGNEKERKIAYSFLDKKNNSKFKKLYLVFFYGRRRFVDRLILFFSVSIGWI